MDGNQTQAIFFNHIKSTLPAHISFVDEVAEVLNISNDSAYRRIRGEKPISLDEVHVLCSKYRISIDQLLQLENNTVIFSGNKVDPLSFGFNNYLLDLSNTLGMFKAMHNAHMYFFTKDIPLFHYMQFPELSAFKFFFWKRTLMGYPELAKQQFKGEEKDPQTRENANNIIKLYTQIPSTEIWTEESIQVTIRQIEFYRHTNIFEDNDILLNVYHQLEELLNHLEMQAEIGKKFIYNQPETGTGAAYHIYVNECLIGDNSIFVKAAEQQMAFLNHNGLNFMGTQDKDFCDYTFKNLQNIISKSAHISLVGEKERSMFFNGLRHKIHEKKRNVR